MWGRRSKAVEPRLLDAEVQHRAAPRTFSIPRRVVRESLRPGDLVKLCFVVDPPVGTVEVERMWVEVVEVADGRYTGRLDNDPSYLKTTKADDRLRFGPEHVIARYTREGDPLFSDPDAFVVVSGRVWSEDRWPRRLERHEVPDPQFSGWFVLAGDEPDDYKANLANFVPVAEAALFDRFRVLDSGLEGPVGTTMEWDDASLEFVEQPARSG
jgi:hypothetical protein